MAIIFIKATILQWNLKYASCFVWNVTTSRNVHEKPDVQVTDTNCMDW